MQENTAPNQRSQQDLDSFANMPVGDILRRTRAHYDLSLRDVETALHIRASQINAIEEGNLENLPGRVYAIGFVRTYAEFLGLDGDKIVHLFKAQIAGNARKPELSMPVPSSESKLPNKYVMAAAFFGLVAFCALIVTLAPDEDVKTIPEPPQQIALSERIVPEFLYGPPHPDNIEALLMVIEPAAGNASKLDRPRIEINATENAWVEIRDSSGKALVSQILKPGDTYFVPNMEDLVMDTGNIGALNFIVDGKKLPALGESGDVRRQMALSPRALLAKPEDESDISDITAVE